MNLEAATKRLAQQAARMLATAARCAGGGAIAEARRVLFAIVRLVPEYGAAWHVLGATYFQSNQALAAALALSECVRLEPDHGPAHALLGELALRAGEITTARRHLETAVRQAAQLTPKHRAWITVLLARCLV